MAAGPVLEPGINYRKLPTTTRFCDMQPGDRVVYSEQTYEVTEAATLSPSGKKYAMKWRMVSFVPRVRYHTNNSYLNNWLHKTLSLTGLTKTMTKRVVYRPMVGFIPHFINEDVL